MVAASTGPSSLTIEILITDPKPGCQPHERERMIGLDSEHHADEGSRDRHHRDALNADGVKNWHQHRPPRPTAKDPDQGQDRELADVTDLGNRIEDLLP